jgi:broad specificity phosphatase PhoE
MTLWPESCCGWVIRHGESAGNAHGLVQGQSLDEGLTARGRAQANRVARLFPRGVHPRIVSSDLRRARETAQALAERTGSVIELTGALRERSLGELEGIAWDQVDPASIGVVDGIVVDPDAAPAGGESIRQFVERVLGALSPLTSAHHSAERVVVVAHGGVLRAVSATLTGLADDGDPLAGLPWPATNHARPFTCCFAELASLARTDLSCPTR